MMLDKDRTFPVGVQSGFTENSWCGFYSLQDVNENLHVDLRSP